MLQRSLSGWAADCPPKPNGNTHAVQVQQHRLIPATISPLHRQIMMAIIHYLAVKRGYIVKGQRLWDLFHPMRGTFMICMVMYGNGVRTGMVSILLIMLLTLPYHLLALTELFGVVAGTMTMPRTYGHRIATTTACRHRSATRSPLRPPAAGIASSTASSRASKRWARSGWPAPVSWPAQSGWEMTSVVTDIFASFGSWFVPSPAQQSAGQVGVSPPEVGDHRRDGDEVADSGIGRGLHSCTCLLVYLPAAPWLTFQEKTPPLAPAFRWGGRVVRVLLPPGTGCSCRCPAVRLAVPSLAGRPRRRAGLLRSGARGTCGGRAAHQITSRVGIRARRNCSQSRMG